MKKIKVIGLGALLGALMLLVVACTVYVEPGQTTVRGSLRFGIELNDVIVDFRPARGERSVYRVGEEISFRVRTTSDGYITLTALDPDGDVYVFARNIFVRGGTTTTISGPSSREVFVLTPPRGLQRVRASFTPERTSGTVRYRDRRGDDIWTQSIVTEVRDYDVRDIAETSFFID